MLNKHISFNCKQQGVSLIEVLISLIISSIVFLAIITLYPLLTQQINRLYQAYHLDIVARQFLLMLEKDVRRSGYCFGDCVGVALKISEKRGEAEHSCIHLIYDYNLDGRWQMANGKWQMANGKWQMANGKWQMANGNWQLATGNWQLATGNWQLATGNWQLATGNWQLATGNWQLATGNR
ncbi:MAG: prepilin-type N-terminal cleavage/methylation domain-containing protein [Candidatus Arsenophonus phytopathogenicus]